MLDKDFDQIFKSSFEDLEIAPAADSWSKITKELDKKGTKKFPIFWMAAASVIVVLGIGVGLYIKPTELIKLTTNKNKMMADLAKEQPTPTTATEDLTVTDDVLVNPEKVATKQVASVNNNTSNQEITENQENIAVDATIAPESNVLIAETNTIKPLRAKSVTEQIIEDEKNIETINRPILTAQSIASVNNIENATNTNRKIKIPTVGDVVNFVVAKVDKRDEKIIRVSKTEESDNEITGINLGLFRFIKAE
ncbi:hypothetical protein ACFSSE_05480 [Pedobacter alpinus]|uniref:Uncharacterized protein n=2 Tax=Pedobacter alpinus TaxID=1590643 RepID=A0ABW5TRJ2_9SPHI